MPPNHSPFFCTTTYKWHPHPSSAGGQSMLSNNRIPRQLSVSGFLYLNPQAPGNWACNVESKIAPSDSVGSSMAGRDSSSVTRTYWAILGSSESSLSMLKISCESILLPVYPQSQRKNYIYELPAEQKWRPRCLSQNAPLLIAIKTLTTLTSLLNHKSAYCATSFFKRFDKCGETRRSEVALDSVIAPVWMRFFYADMNRKIKTQRKQLWWFPRNKSRRWFFLNFPWMVSYKRCFKKKEQ